MERSFRFAFFSSCNFLGLKSCVTSSPSPGPTRAAGSPKGSIPTLYQNRGRRTTRFPPPAIGPLVHTLWCCYSSGIGGFPASRPDQSAASIACGGNEYDSGPLSSLQQVIEGARRDGGQGRRVSCLPSRDEDPRGTRCGCRRTRRGRAGREARGQSAEGGSGPQGLCGPGSFPQPTGPSGKPARRNAARPAVAFPGAGPDAPHAGHPACAGPASGPSSLPWFRAGPRAAGVLPAQQQRQRGATAGADAQVAGIEARGPSEVAGRKRRLLGRTLRASAGPED